MSILLEASSAVSSQVVPPADYVKFLTEELARHRVFLDDSINKLGAFLVVVLASIGGAATFMGWKSLKDVRESTQEMFKGAAKTVFDENVAELSLRIQEIASEHENSRKNISELEQTYKAKLASMQDWLIKLQTDASLSTALPQEGKPSLTILWVDDYPQNNISLIDTLSDHGIKIRTALSTKRATDLIAKNSYDILISDIARPEAEDAGIRLLRLLPAEGKPLDRIIYASRSAISKFGDEAKQAGATLVTSKPRELLELILQKSSSRVQVE